jgi:hypothetical protein
VKRTIGGVVFECVRSGLWVTQDHRYAIVEQMHGTLEHEWLLFRTNLHELSDDPIKPPVDLEDANFWSGWQIGHHFTMGELAHDVATEFLTAAQIEIVRRAMLGVPRKKAYHRAILADCGAALGGDAVCRGSVARAWLKINENSLVGRSIKTRVRRGLRRQGIPDLFDDLFPNGEQK